MLFLPTRSRLLLGAMTTSVTLGLVIVFALSGASSTAKHTVNPVLDTSVGALILVIAFAVGTGRDTRRPHPRASAPAAERRSSPAVPAARPLREHA